MRVLRGSVPPGASSAGIAYQLLGGPSAAPLLLLPGQANSHRWWDGLRERFAETHLTITFDYRGTGDSRFDDDGAAWSTTSFAADAVGVLDHLGYDRVSVYGTSMGGRVAQMLAIGHPDRVARLVLAATMPGGRHAHEPGPDVRRALLEPDAAVRTRTLIELFYTPAWAEKGLSSNLLGDPTMTSQAASRHLKASAGHDAYDALPGIEAPTLVLHGGDDRLTPVANAYLLCERIRGAQLRITPSGRHGFFDEFADEVTPVIQDFLA